jgi:hypothetical protein
LRVSADEKGSFYIALIRRAYTYLHRKLNTETAMTTAVLINAILGIILFAGVLTLLAGAVRRGNVDRGAAIATLRRQMHDHRRTGTARPRTSWAPRPDAS